MRNLPAHQHHQEKSKLHEAQRGETVLDANDLVVSGKNIFAPEARLVVLGMAVVVVGVVFTTFAERRKLLDGRFHIFYFNLSMHIAASSNGR